MAIKSGIGFGEAQVFDSSSLVNTYAKLLAQQQKEEQKYQSELADIMATVKTDGVRDADKPIIANTYGEIKKLYSEAVNNKDPQQRALNRSLIKEKIASLNEYSARSNQFAKEYKSFAAQVAPNIWKYDTKKIDEFKLMANKPLVELGDRAVIDPFDYIPKIDDSARDKVQSDIYKQEEKRIGAKDYIKETIAGTGERYVGVGDKNRVINDITSKLATSPQYRQLAYSTYADMNPGAVSPDLEDVIANELKMYEQKFGYKYEGSISRIPKEPKGDTIIIGGDATQPKTFYSEEQKVKDKSGKTVVKPSSKMVEFDAFIGVNPQQFSLPQLDKRLNITTGKWEPYRSSGNVEIVGVGRRSGSGAYNVIVQDKDGFEYMVTEQDLPVGIRNNKIYKAAKASVYSSRPSAPKPSTPPSPSPKPNKNIIPGKKDSRL